eukprot:jgi/Psemu1/42575/gm1.42575_g
MKCTICACAHETHHHKKPGCEKGTRINILGAVMAVQNLRATNTSERRLTVITKRLNRPISLLLKPYTKRVKLDLIKAQVEERYPELKLPSPIFDNTGGTGDLKIAFTSLVEQLKVIRTLLVQSKMKVEELDLSSIDLQLAAIKLIIGERTGTHDQSTLMVPDMMSIANDLANLKTRPVALPTEDQEKPIAISAPVSSTFTLINKEFLVLTIREKLPVNYEHYYEVSTWKECNPSFLATL